MSIQKMYLVLILCLGTYGLGLAQETENKIKSNNLYQPLILPLNEDGDKYLRLITWHQFRLTSQNLSLPIANGQLNPTINRSRIAFLGKVSPKFLIWTQVGINNVSLQSLPTVGGKEIIKPQFFIHDAWAELKINEFLYVGGGLHYWKGMTRMANASTIKFMTLDQSRPLAAWYSLGITDQSGRHLGLYFKGQINKFDYRLAFNAPSGKTLGDGQDYGIKNSSLSYDGVRRPNVFGQAVGSTIIEGYFRYNFWDTESNLLPSQAGTYLGKKSILGIGAGFFAHPNGMYCSEIQQHKDVLHFAIDFFLDKPIHHRNALNAYLAIQRFNYGKNYVSRWTGTGHNFYGQMGYYLGSLKIMPYAAFQSGKYEGLDNQISTVDIGLNYFIHGHHAKITLEYHRIQGDIREAGIFLGTDAVSQLRLQMQLFL